ncbi:MAG: DUF3786 domain-containing protein [Methanomassiliicoccus sp.]|nr:DUF3786 domain-containing protein [Methanomassiliicoccus sp.]
MAGAFRAALEAAWTTLEGRDHSALAADAGVTVEKGMIMLDLLDQRCVICLEERRMSIEGENVDEAVTILVLHYLVLASGTVPSGNLLSFRQLHGGAVYYAAFKSRVNDVLGELYRRHPAPLLQALDKMGAERSGNSAFILWVLPRLPVTLFLREGDEEVPGTATLLFDATAPLFLPVEDLAEAGTWVVDRLTRVTGDQLRPTNRPSSV